MDIGNDGSAFVEVLVGSSAGGAGEQDYEVSRALGWAPCRSLPQVPPARPQASQVPGQGGGESL